MTESEIRADERMKCWREINALIEPGHLTGEAYALRDGLMMACNAVAVKDAEYPPEWLDALKFSLAMEEAPYTQVRPGDQWTPQELASLRKEPPLELRKPWPDPRLAPIDYAIGPRE